MLAYLGALPDRRVAAVRPLCTPAVHGCPCRAPTTITMRSFSDLPVELANTVLELVVADAHDDFAMRKQLAELARLSRRTRALAVPLLYRTVEITHGNRARVFNTVSSMPKLFTENTKHLVCELTLSTPAELHPRSVIDAFYRTTRFSGCYQVRQFTLSSHFF